MTELMGYDIGCCELAQAARDYVAARVANEQAEPSDWTAARARIDGAYLRLLVLAGFQNEEGDE